MALLRRGSAAGALVALLVAATLWPLLWTGYTTSDDVQIASQGFARTWEIALGSGRLTWLLGAPWGVLGSIQGDAIAWKLPRIVGLLAMVAALGYLVRQVSRSAPLGLLAALLATVFWQNGWEHNGFTSYPMSFTAPLAMVFVSVGLYMRYLERPTWPVGVGVAGLFFLSFSSELFATLAWLHALAFVHAVGARGHRVAGAVLVRCVPVALPVVGFALAYFAFLEGKPTMYQLEGRDFMRALRTLTMSGFPGLYIKHNGSLEELFRAASASGLLAASLKGILVAALVAWLGSVGTPVGRRRSLAIAAVALLFAFWVNVPVAATDRYQQWVRDVGTKAYVYSAFSTLGFGTALAAVVVWAGSFRTPAARLALGVVALGIGAVAGITHLNNAKVFADQKLSHVKWVYVDKLARGGAFLSLPEDAIVVSPALFQCHNIVCFRTADYWTQYVHRRFGIAVEIRSEPGETRGRPVYQLNRVAPTGLGGDAGRTLLDADMTDPHLPAEVAMTRGLSEPSPGGREVAGPEMEIVLLRTPPRKLVVTLRLAGASGALAGRPCVAVFGDAAKAFLVVPVAQVVRLTMESSTPTNSFRISGPSDVPARSHGGCGGLVIKAMEISAAG